MNSWTRRPPSTQQGPSRGSDAVSSGPPSPEPYTFDPRSGHVVFAEAQAGSSTSGQPQAAMNDFEA